MAQGSLPGITRPATRPCTVNLHGHSAPAGLGGDVTFSASRNLARSQQILDNREPRNLDHISSSDDVSTQSTIHLPQPDSARTDSPLDASRASENQCVGPQISSAVVWAETVSEDTATQNSDYTRGLD